MNEFLRLMHEGLIVPTANERSIDTTKEIVRGRQRVEPIRERLKTAFPVRPRHTEGDQRPLAVTAVDADALTAFRGVGPKCAHLAVGIACNEPFLGVDIHVHRVTNRWGYVQAKNPEKTMLALQQKLPRRYWVEINALLVPFGKHICTGFRPKCSTCPVLEYCRQIGVVRHR